MLYLLKEFGAGVVDPEQAAAVQNQSGDLLLIRLTNDFLQCHDMLVVQCPFKEDVEGRGALCPLRNMYHALSVLVSTGKDSKPRATN